MRRCLYPNCDGALFGRGLCMKHYVAARRHIKAGRTTWEWLERNGKSLPLQRRGRPMDEWFFDRKVVGNEK